MIGLESHPEGTILPVRAHPGARRNQVTGCHDGWLKVSVTQAPEKGKANKALITLLSGALGVKKSDIELLAGQTSQQKRFLVRGVTPEDLSRRIAPLLAGDG